MRDPGKFYKTILLTNWELAGVLTVGVQRTILHTMLEKTEPVPPNIVVGGKMASQVTLDSRVI